MRCVDLHMHSCCSDGSKSAEELILEAKQKNLVAISITDHQTVDAYKKIDLNRTDINIMPGVELISIAGRCSIEVLIYGFDVNVMDRFIKDKCLSEKKQAQIKIVRSMEMFKNLGAEIEFDAENY